MKQKILIGMCIILLLTVTGCSTLTEEDCKQIAINQANEYQDLGHQKGIGEGIDICEENYKRVMEQYTPPEDCMILIIDKMTARYICKGDKYYEELWSP